MFPMDAEQGFQPNIGKGEVLLLSGFFLTNPLII